MARVFIPKQMRDLTGGAAEVTVDGRNVGDLVARLGELFPGFAERVVRDGRIAPGLAVAVDNEISTRGLRAPVGAESVVHFVPAIAGG
jgi:molybdopterin converting factor small subunit